MASGIFDSIKWSGLSEIGAKLFTPISTMIMARILSPEAFGVLAVCTLITTFVEIIADAGFGKYIVQADFQSEDHFEKSVKVAFWSHFFLSALMTGLIVLFSDYLARSMGIPGHGLVISVSSLQLLVMAFVSIQLALLRRRLEFRKVFISRIVSVVTNFIVTISLAFILRSYWAVVFGTLSGYVANAIALSFLTRWVPRPGFKFALFKEMFSYSFWSLMEGLAHWFIFNVDIFLASGFFSVYFLGLYKNCSQMVLSFYGMITASMSPVLLSVLSRLKNDPDFDGVYFKISKLFMFVVFPVSIGIYYCRDFATLILFGPQWSEGAEALGLWALMLGVSLFVYSFPAEIFKSKGVPKHLFFYQLCYLCILTPLCYVGALKGFRTFVYLRTGAVLLQVILYVITMWHFFRWNVSSYLEHYAVVFRPNLVLLAAVVVIDQVAVANIWVRPVIFIGLLGIYYLYYRRFLSEEMSEDWKLLFNKRVVTTNTYQK